MSDETAMMEQMRTETVLIVAKTRQGSGACIGGITATGRSVRLIAADAEYNERAGREYEVGDVWEVVAAPASGIIPPHVENIVVHDKCKLREAKSPESAICRFMAPRTGGPEVLYEGLTQATEAGALYIARHSGVPPYSTMFWQPDQALHRDDDGKRIRYRYPTPEGGRSLIFVGFQEPLEMMPAGSLLRVSLAHWWRPDEKSEQELRCFVQLSGWFLPCPPPTASAGQTISPAGEALQTTSIPSQTSPAGMAEARRLLKSVFGYDDFWPLQKEVITNLLGRRDTLAVMPTGGGKSLCYQLPSLLFEGLTIVVSPLIALMQDQVDAMRELGIPAVYLNSTLDIASYTATVRRIRAGQVRLLYVSPETLLRPETLVMLDQVHVACISIDEAHCISTWGHDFRPEYRQLLPVRERYPQAVCFALTATATRRVQDDIATILGIRTADRFIASFNRPNLYLGLEPRMEGLRQTLDFLEAHRDQSGIIYCSTREQVETLAAQLSQHGWPALPYHAGLDGGARLRHQRAFTRDDADIIVATIAFGMGINKSNVRFVLHYNLPKDIESYYQEIGRAGRDGEQADCLLLFSFQDVAIISHFIKQGVESEREAGFARLKQLTRYTSAHTCRRQVLLQYFGEAFTQTPCGMCDNCLAETNEQARAKTPELAKPAGVKPEAGGADGSGQEAELTDVTVAAQKFLSCVKRTRQRFGVNHIIKILRGSQAKDLLRYHHEQLSTYGIGREYSEKRWKRMVTLFLQLGLVTTDSEYGAVRVTPAGERVLRGEKVLVPVETKLRRTAGAAQTQTYDAVLFQKLRLLRKQVADEAGVPPFVIFSDRSLIQMAVDLPQSSEEFLAVQGVGQRKLERYGNAFLAVIRTHVAEQGPVELVTVPVEPTVQVPSVPGKRRHEVVGEAFAAGTTVAELQHAYGVQRWTILGHLYHFMRAGGRVGPDQVRAASGLTTDQQKRVLAQFDELGDEYLKPVFEALDGTVDYVELRVMQLYRMSLRLPVL